MHKRIRQITLSDLPLEKQKELCRYTGISHKRDLTGIYVFEWEASCEGCGNIMRYKTRDESPNLAINLCPHCDHGGKDAA